MENKRGRSLNEQELESASGGKSVVETTIKHYDDETGELDSIIKETKFFGTDTNLSSDPTQDNKPLPLNDIDYPYSYPGQN